MAEKRKYWLLKTEPGEWSWEDQAQSGGISQWDGVNNKQALNNLNSMNLGDLCFFYHSGSRFRRIVGVVSVVRTGSGAGGAQGAPEVRCVGQMRRAVDLKELKADHKLNGFRLFRQPRLSVVPVPKTVWDHICEIAGGYEGEEEIIT